MSAAEPLRDYHVEAAAYHLDAGISEQRFSAAIPDANSPIAIGEDHRIRRLRHETLKQSQIGTGFHIQ
jgi:hypothetical protein